MLAETVRDCLTRSMKRNHTRAEISQVLLSSSVSCRCDESLWSRVPSSHSSGWAEYPHAAGYTGGLELVIGSWGAANRLSAEGRAGQGSALSHRTAHSSQGFCSPAHGIWALTPTPHRAHQLSAATAQFHSISPHGPCSHASWELCNTPGKPSSHCTGLDVLVYTGFQFCPSFPCCTSTQLDFEIRHSFQTQTMFCSIET